MGLGVGLILALAVRLALLLLLTGYQTRLHNLLLHNHVHEIPVHAVVLVQHVGHPGRRGATQLPSPRDHPAHERVCAARVEPARLGDGRDATVVAVVVRELAADRLADDAGCRLEVGVLEAAADVQNRGGEPDVSGLCEDQMSVLDGFGERGGVCGAGSDRKSVV